MPYLDDDSEALHFKDCNGNKLNEGDSVTVIKDLKVGKSSMTIKQGTVIKNVRFTDDEEHISCKIGKAEIWLKTCFLKKR